MLNGWILPIVGASSGRVCSCSLRKNVGPLNFFFTKKIQIKTSSPLLIFFWAKKKKKYWTPPQKKIFFGLPPKFFFLTAKKKLKIFFFNPQTFFWDPLQKKRKKTLKKKRKKIVLLFLSASVERFSVSRMKDFSFTMCLWKFSPSSQYSLNFFVFLKKDTGEGSAVDQLI